MDLEDLFGLSESLQSRVKEEGEKWRKSEKQAFQLGPKILTLFANFGVGEGGAHMFPSLRASINEVRTRNTLTLQTNSTCILRTEG